MHSARRRRRKSSCGKKLKIKKERKEEKKVFKQFMFAFKASPLCLTPPAPPVPVPGALARCLLFPSHRTLLHKYLVTEILNFFENSGPEAMFTSDVDKQAPFQPWMFALEHQTCFRGVFIAPFARRLSGKWGMAI
jgi:hypothetical protein